MIFLVNVMKSVIPALREKCLNTELSWSDFPAFGNFLHSVAASLRFTNKIFNSFMTVDPVI